ncbi:G1/S-specific cyclin-E-like [Mytilus edulis]|uniref:Cyclin E n=1 Tax=Mytilus galloprovincialis TaxID=29158 RepID=A0A8B6CT29_MYTGA|nr:cyclin E [Mytilus galloprovincialis]
MSRKSARLQSRVSIESSSSSIAVSTVSRKRKAEEDLEDEMIGSKRSRNYRIENTWIPISHESSITTCTLVPTSEPLSPVSDRSSSPDLTLGAKFRFRNYFTPTVSRHSPLPRFSWADSREVWQNMMTKEQHYARNPNVFDKHPMLQPRMRTILLDWLIEVCEVYRLHRETFYLATDFLDRFLCSSHNAQKHQLQLVGITCLFIGAKLEEIYPPKLAEFAYVTDGACTEEEIMDQELVIIKALNWDLSPVTANGWLNVYLQVANIEYITDTEHGFVFPQYSSHAFVQIAQLIDLCTLDIGCLAFTYSAIAAAALYHLTDEDVALSVSGYKWQDILPCVNWMTPFAQTTREKGHVEVKFFSNVATEDCHNIQTHEIDINLLERAQEIQEQLMTLHRSSSPDIQAQVITQLTPPSSNKKGNSIVSEDKENKEQTSIDVEYQHQTVT